MSDHAREAGHEHHVLAVSLYLKIFAGLIVLLFLTVAAAYVDMQHFIPIPGVNIIIALVIAIIKAAMVVLVFMHVRYQTRLTWLWAALGFIWLLLLAGIVSDYVARAWIPVTGWEY